MVDESRDTGSGVENGDVTGNASAQWTLKRATKASDPMLGPVQEHLDAGLR